jgi:hypothetical protein
MVPQHTSLLHDFTDITSLLDDFTDITSLLDDSGFLAPLAVWVQDLALPLVDCQ